MREYIKKLQEKDENTKKRILVVSLSVSMFVVGSIWIGDLTGRFNKKIEQQHVQANKEEVKPFALFKDSVSETYKNITASVGNVSFIKKQEAPKQIDLIVVDNPVNQ